MADTNVKDAAHTSASLVGAPPYALPVEDGGEAAVVGHPEPPATLAESPVRGDTDGLSAPHEAKGGGKTNVKPVVEDVATGEDGKPADPPPGGTDPHKHAVKKAPAKKTTAKKAAPRRR